MAVVPLNGDPPNNIPDFLNSLFSDGARSPSIVTSAATKGDDHASFADHPSRKIILESWLAAWKQACGDTPGHYKDDIRPLDQKLLSFLANYIKSNSLMFCKPKLTRTSSSYEPKAAGVPFYTNSHYSQESFFDSTGHWSYGTFDENGMPRNDGTVTRFLWYLFYGAHFVVICSSHDGAVGVPDFEQSFETSLFGYTFPCPGNSHYPLPSIIGDLPNLATDEYYLKINSPADATVTLYIVAFLAGDTNSTTTLANNGFFQLEGWQAQVTKGLKGGTRHEGDLNAHLATIWNISTFGASPYSEKRSTPIFLAQKSFSLAIDNETHMPRYAGGWPVAHWMKPGYLTGGRLDEVLLDVADAPGHLYFFQGEQVVHYDPDGQKPDGPPQGIETVFPGLKKAGVSKVDAAFCWPGANGGKGTYTFISGSTSVHYDPVTQKVLSTHEAGERFYGLPFTTIDATLRAPAGDGNTYIWFFSGPSYAKYNPATQEFVGKPGNIRDDFLLSALTGFTSVDAAEYRDHRFLLFSNDQVVFSRGPMMSLDLEHDVQHIYGKTKFPGLWWTPPIS